MNADEKPARAPGKTTVIGRTMVLLALQAVISVVAVVILVFDAMNVAGCGEADACNYDLDTFAGWLTVCIVGLAFVLAVLLVVV
jgi:hypothetical protein